MRDVNRIQPFCKRVGEIWAKNCPDWRFGQLIVNVFGGTDPFFLSEEDFIKALEKFFGNEE